MKGLTGITSDNDIYKFTVKVNLYKQSILTDYIATPPFFSKNSDIVSTATTLLHNISCTL